MKKRHTKHQIQNFIFFASFSEHLGWWDTFCNHCVAWIFTFFDLTTFFELRWINPSLSIITLLEQSGMAQGLAADALLCPLFAEECFQFDFSPNFFSLAHGRLQGGFFKSYYRKKCTQVCRYTHMDFSSPLTCFQGCQKPLSFTFPVGRNFFFHKDNVT